MRVGGEELAAELTPELAAELLVGAAFGWAPSENNDTKGSDGWLRHLGELEARRGMVELFCMEPDAECERVVTDPNGVEPARWECGGHYFDPEVTLYERGSAVVAGECLQGGLYALTEENSRTAQGAHFWCRRSPKRLAQDVLAPWSERSQRGAHPRAWAPAQGAVTRGAAEAAEVERLRALRERVEVPTGGAFVGIEVKDGQATLRTWLCHSLGPARIDMARRSMTPEFLVLASHCEGNEPLTMPVKLRGSALADVIVVEARSAFKVARVIRDTLEGLSIGPVKVQKVTADPACNGSWCVLPEYEPPPQVPTAELPEKAEVPSSLRVHRHDDEAMALRAVLGAVTWTPEEEEVWRRRVEWARGNGQAPPDEAPAQQGPVRELRYECSVCRRQSTRPGFCAARRVTREGEAWTCKGSFKRLAVTAPAPEWVSCPAERVRNLREGFELELKVERSSKTRELRGFGPDGVQWHRLASGLWEETNTGRKAAPVR